MPDEIRLEGLGLKPGVIDRIVVLAATQVEGVAFVCGQGLAGFVGKSSAAKGLDVTVDDEGAVSVDLHIEVEYGRPLPSVATSVQEAVFDAVRSQIGAPVTAVNVFIDGVVFAE